MFLACCDVTIVSSIKSSWFFNWFCFLFQVRFSSSADDSTFSLLRIFDNSINSKWFINCLFYSRQSDNSFNELIFVAFVKWLLISDISSFKSDFDLVKGLTIDAEGKFWGKRSWGDWFSPSDVKFRPEFSPSGEFLLNAATCNLIDIIDQIRPSECYVSH